MEKLWEWLQKFWSIPLFVIGVITEVSQFVELWRGARDTFTLVTAGVGLFVIVITISYIAFSKVESPIIRAHRTQKFIPRFPKIYIYARVCLGIILVVILVAGMMLYRQDLELRSKLVVLVATFDGPDPEKYRVTDIVVDQLNAAIAKYNDTVIKPISNSITENDGSDLAKKIGKEYRADLVIWGWYGVTETDVILTVHVENLGDANTNTFSNDSYTVQNGVEEFKSFRFQQHLSEQMTSLALFAGGILRYEARDYEGAISRLTLARDLYIWPEEINSKEVLYSYLGDAYINSYDYEKALQSYTLAIDANPNNAKNYISRCAAFSDLGNLEGAFKDCDKATQIKPLAQLAYGARAMVYLSLGDFDNALVDANKEVEFFPEEGDSYSVRAYILNGINKMDESLLDIQHAIRLDPDIPHHYLSLGILYSHMRNYPKCIAAANNALRRSSEPYYQAFSYSVRSDCYSNMGKIAKAFSDINTAIKLDPRNDDYYYSRGFLYNVNDQIEKAISDYSKALEINPRRTSALINRGGLFFGQGLYQKALSDFQMAVDSYPFVVKGWYWMGRTYSELGQPYNAILAFSKTLELNSASTSYNGGVSYADIYYQRGLAFVELGNTDLAVEDFKSCLTSPDITDELRSKAQEQLSSLGNKP